MMNRTFFFLFLLISFVACNKDGKETIECIEGAINSQGSTDCSLSAVTDVDDEGSSLVDEPITDDDDTSLPNLAFTFDADIEFLSMTLTQEEKFNRAIDLIKRIVATEEFRSKILNHTYNGKKTFVDNGGFTNAQIYQKILEGAETLKPIKNNTMDMQVKLYYENNNVVGYTYPSTTKIWVNTKYFETNSIARVAANLMHEWLHKLGFKHAVTYSVSRDYSVPYAVGRIITSLSSLL